MHPLCCQLHRPVPHYKQLLNHIVDCRASIRPETLFAEFPKSATTYDEGFHKITYGRLAIAIDHVAHWLVSEFGVGKEHETLAYLGPNDFLYPALILGCIKAGYKLLLLSPRNSVAAQLHLLDAAKCVRVLTPVQRHPSIDAVAKGEHGSRFTFHQVPTVAELLQAKRRPFQYAKTLAEAASDPFLVMHTSGSTGMPKLITWRQSFVPAYAKIFLLEPPADMDSTDRLYQGNRIFIVFPPFHAAYVAFVIINAICNQTTVILPLAAAIPTATSFANAIRNTKMDTAVVVPTIVEEMGRDPETLEYVASNIDRLIFGGGDIPDAYGQPVASKIDLVNFYGTTEGASLPLVRPIEELRTPSDWHYLSYHPDSGAEFRPYANDTYELVVVRKPELEQHQPLFDTFPEKCEYFTKDLYKRHPTNPNLWYHCGRADDIIVFLTGEKTNPVTFELSILDRHPKLTGVLLVGAQRFQAGVVLELKDATNLSTEEKAAIVEEVWPTIEMANEECPAHAKVTKSHIWFADPKRPFLRSPKGNVQRAATVALYVDSLDDWYAKAESESNEVDNVALDLQDTAALTDYVRERIRSITGHVFPDGENFFQLGTDSLQALLLTQALKTKLSRPQLNVSLVYGAPSIQQLVAAVQTQGASASPAVLSNGQPLVVSRRENLESTLQRFSKLVDKIEPSMKKNAALSTSTDLKRHILLLGSTGSFGAQLLEDLLLQRDDVAHITCLNRASDGGLAQQLVRSKTAGYKASSFPSSRVTFLQTNLGAPDLGLSASNLEKLRSSVTHIIFNAWSVNFNTPLSSFDAQIAGVVHVSRLANECVSKPTLVFMSSVAAASNLPALSAAKDKSSAVVVPEAVLSDVLSSSATGYGESKYVSERLLERVAKRLDLDVRIMRLGQIAGPLKEIGARWNPQEWLPSILRSSAHIGLLPDQLPGMLARIDWIPIDVLSNVVIDLSTEKRDLGNGHEDTRNAPVVLYNVLNLHPIKWEKLVPVVKKTIASSLAETKDERSLSVVSFSQWLDKVRAMWQSVAEGVNGDSRVNGNGSTASAASKAGKEDITRALDSNPAVKLLGFFEDCNRHEPGVLDWATDKAAEASASLRGLEGIKEEWMARWTREAVQ